MMTFFGCIIIAIAIAFSSILEISPGLEEITKELKRIADALEKQNIG